MSRSADALATSRHLTLLREMRSGEGATRTPGLADDVILRFLGDDTSLATAIERGHEHFRHLQKARPDLLRLDESE